MTVLHSVHSFENVSPAVRVLINGRRPLHPVLFAGHWMALFTEDDRKTAETAGTAVECPPRHAMFADVGHCW